MRVMLVEDDPDISRPLRRTLEREGFQVAVCDEGQVAIETARSWDPDILLLDLNLPDIPGTDVALEFRRFSSAPIIMVTGRGEIDERIKGLDAGADDYIVKPFDSAELLARIRAVARRPATGPTDQDAFEVGDITLDTKLSIATRGGVDLDLTPKEFEFLRLLARSAGTLVRRDEVARTLWGMSPADAANTVDVHLKRLRTKLEDAGNSVVIETVRGQGFRLLIS
jgi:two-component system, OmpR family, response regulator RegX3